MQLTVTVRGTKYELHLSQARTSRTYFVDLFSRGRLLASSMYKDRPSALKSFQGMAEILIA